jgi:hypothetical protein
MRVRALTSTGDFSFGNSQNNYLQGAAAVQQCLSTALKSFLGNCFFDAGRGLDWFNLLGSTGSQAQVAIALAVNATILAVPNVTAIVSSNINYSPVTRSVVIDYVITTSFGPVSDSVVNQI